MSILFTGQNMASMAPLAPAGPWGPMSACWGHCHPKSKNLKSDFLQGAKAQDFGAAEPDFEPMGPPGLPGPYGPVGALVFLN